MSEYRELPREEHDVKLNLETRWEQRYRKWIVLTIFLLFSTCAVLVAVITATTKEKSGDKFSFEDIFSSDMKVVRKTVRWLEDGQDGSFTLTSNGDIYIQRLPDVQPTLFAKASDIKDENGKALEFFDYWISADEKFILLGTSYEKIWRHSFTAIYYLYDMSAKTSQKLADQKTLAAIWSPTGHSLAYVIDNNVYIYENLINRIQVTSDGSPSIFNGIPPWVYEEEIYGTYYALWWSTNSKKLAYLKADESEVETFLMPIYGRTQYPEQIAIKYPKPGTKNPVASLVVYNTETSEYLTPDYGYTEEFLIVDVDWRDENRVLARLTNRNQFVGKLFETDTTSGQTRKIFEKSLTNGWLEYFRIFPIPGTDYFVELIDIEGYNHLALYSFTTLEIVRPLTQGNWEVTEISGFHEPTSRVFYVSTEENPWERHLYSVNINEGISSKTLLTTPPAFNSFSLSPKGGFYLENYNGPDVPFQILKSTTSKDFSYLVEDNAKLKEKLSTYDLPEKKFVKIPIPANGEFAEPYSINGMITVPPDFVETRRYPLLVRVYGGPASNLVQMNFALDWHTYLASSLGYIVASFDARGTAQNGNRHKYAVYKHLGEYEAYDQVEAARYLTGLKYVDRDHTSIWGWSYGGYMTTKVLETGSGVFQKGIAVAPVTDWKFYDTVYTERYMLTPQENPAGYEKSAVRNFANINETHYFLIHGTADDNVHFQHAAILVGDLTNAGVDFDLHFYTDNDHRINTGQNTQPDLYRRITEFLEREDDE